MYNTYITMHVDKFFWSYLFRVFFFLNDSESPRAYSYYAGRLSGF